eukprot:gene6689-13409_t
MAVKWRMYVVGTFYAWGTSAATRDLAYNSAPFFSRNGTLLGVHNKNELYDPEEDYGVTPGMDGFPVFHTDLIVFPSAGYDPTLLPARAADSGVWIVAATHHAAPEGSANVWDSAGNRGGVPIDSQKDAGTSILNFTRDNSTKT